MLGISAMNDKYVMRYAQCLINLCTCFSCLFNAFLDVQPRWVHLR
jgi:hypothetical protein